MQNIDNKFERLDNLPEPAKLRIFELMAALNGALALPQLPENQSINTVKSIINPEPQKNVAELVAFREAKEQATDAELLALDARDKISKIKAA